MIGSLRKTNELKEVLLKIKVNVGQKVNFELIRNKYEVDETDNIKTPNTCWFLLQPSKIDSKMNRYKINPGEIIKIGRITMRIRDVIFANKKLNQHLNESYDNNMKEMQTMKTEGNVYNITSNGNENDKNIHKINNLKTCEKIIIRKNNNKKSQKEIFTKLEKKNKVCRICYMEEGGEENPLVQPCTCTGSMKYIHLSCLKQWIGTRSCIKIDNTEDCSIFLIKHVECELCKTKFPDYIKHEGILYPLLDFSKEFSSYLTLESLTLDKQKNKFIYVISLENNKKLKVGRGHEADIVLSDISVSRVHCFMVIENKKVFLEDNSSKFGTLILVQTPSIKISEDLPLFVQVGRTFFQCKVKKPFKLFSCCEAEEKNSIYYYYNQNEKYIKDNLGMVIKPDVSELDDDEDKNINNTFEQKYPLDIAKKYKVNNSMKIENEDKMSDNEYLLMKHNKLNKNIKKTMIYNENIDDNKNKKKKKEDKNNDKEEQNKDNENEEEEEEIEDESGNNNSVDNVTASMNNLNGNGSISVSVDSDN